MSEALSIKAAAREVPDRIALIDGEVAYSYRALAELVENAASQEAVIGAPALDAIVQSLARLERDEPLVLLHPRWVERERKEILSALASPLALGRDGAPSPMTQLELPRDGDSGLIPRGAIIFFTSGTTGKPKGVVHTKRSIEASCRAVLKRLAINPDARWLCALPIAHVAGFAVVMRALISRSTLILGTERDLEQATIASLVPTMLHRLLDTPLTATTTILLGGAAANTSLIDRAKARGLRVITTYGLTETFGGIALDGVPLEGVDLRISKNQTIEVRGPMLAAGYLDCPFDQDAYFDTKDVGAFKGHRLEIYARRSELIITGGENVYPTEVEAALESSELVARACVFGVPDDRWGEIICAAIVPAKIDPAKISPAASFDRAALDRHLAGVLAPFKRPRRLAIVRALPETSQGKLDRRQARHVFEGGQRLDAS
jgi:o-succinylbenzoate---CoA ligase